jgi:ribosomal-protein-alanine N-acetyltransferase
MKDYLQFETERLVVRPTNITDAAYLLKLMTSEKWLRFIGDRNLHSLADAENYITTRMRPQLERLGFSNYTVIRKSDQQKMGSVGLYDRPDVDFIDIGFAFLEEFEGKGYAFEAATVVKNAAFKHFGFNELCAITSKNNYSSQKLLEKLGLENAGDIQMPGDEEVLFIYKMMKPEL